MAVVNGSYIGILGYLMTEGQMSLTDAIQIIGRVVESPGMTHDITDRQLAEACAVVLVRNHLLAPPSSDDE